MEPRSRSWILCLGPALLVSAAASTAHGQCIEFEKFTANTTNWIGYSIAVDGDVLVAGAPSEGLAPPPIGWAYVFRFDPGAKQWNLEATLANPSPVDFDFYGYSVAVKGDRIVVGTPQIDNARVGAAYVYARTNGVWTADGTLTPSDGTVGATFGWSVALGDNDTCFVGAPYQDNSNGSVYVYKRDPVNGWTETQILSIGPLQKRWFGTSISVQGDRLLTGATAEGPTIAEEGAAYLFERDVVLDTWSVVHEFTSTTPTGFAHFGLSVDLDGDEAAIGARDAACAYVVQTVTPYAELVQFHSPNVGVDFFGNSVAKRGNRVVIGAPLETAFLSPQSGAVYLFTTDGKRWEQTVHGATLAPIDYENLGQSVAILDDTRIVAGAPLATSGASDIRNIYIYPGADVILDVSPQAAASGANITFAASCGPYQSPLMLTMSSFGGSPTFIPLLISAFPMGERWELQATVPPGLAGLSVGFKVYEIGVFGKLAASNEQVVDFQ